MAANPISVCLSLRFGINIDIHRKKPAMGRTSRWLRSLLGGKKEPKQAHLDSPRFKDSDKTKEKRRWSFGKISRDHHGNVEHHRESFSTQNCVRGAETEQNRHAIAVAAATAAAADAAMAAAQAAAAVVRLTSNGPSPLNGSIEKRAAIKIQTMFRGYLARRALRALKGLVKLQALVRGYLVRKEADATLCSMQALIRAQGRVRAHRLKMTEHAAGQSVQMQQKQRRRHDYRPQRFIEGCNFNSAVDKINYSQSRRGFANGFPQQEMERNSDDSAKIVEIDTFKPGQVASLRRTNASSISDSGSAEPSISSTVSAGGCQFSNSPLITSSSLRTGLSIPSSVSDEISTSSLHDLTPIKLKEEHGFHTDDYKFSTAQRSPQFLSASKTEVATGNMGPATPSKSHEHAERYFHGCCTFPSYMANTESSRAKVRSHSAPKQRPQPSEKTTCSLRRKIPLHEVVERRSSFSGVRMQKTTCCLQLHADLCCQHADPGRLDRPTMSFRDTNRLQTYW